MFTKRGTTRSAPRSSAFTIGCSRSASHVALTTNGRYVSFTPNLSRKDSFQRSRSRTRFSTLTSTIPHPPPPTPPPPRDHGRDVPLRDPAPRPGARDAGEVQVGLLGESSHQRRQDLRTWPPVGQRNGGRRCGSDHGAGDRGGL